MENNMMNPQNLTAMNLLSPQQVAYHPHLFVEESPVKAIITKEPRGSQSQMTIFYNGHVIVFDDVPAEKAKEVMSFANKGTSQSTQNNYAYTFSHSHPSFLANTIIGSSSANNSSVQDHPPQVPSASTPVVYDLPMTRKASLHRFLEKRKDRIAARAPYQKSSPMGNLDKPIEESMAWLALAPQSPQDNSECSSSSVLF